MYQLQYRTFTHDWVTLGKYKTVSGALSGRRAHSKRFGFGYYGVIMGDEYRVV